ncbi:MAG TPA: hypothetical protein VM032_17060 [Vicinamibacterales bacterium]|nr:hypothetical protein [Vicinamibacterales bacterium]
MHRRPYAASGLAALIALSIACGRSPATTVAPTSTATSSADAGAAADGSTLKVSAPTLVTPINDDTSADTTPTLVATEATGKYVQGSLAYDFELYDDQNVKIQTLVVNGLSWKVGALEFAKRYTWRVRATTDSAYGPWSPFASFYTPEGRGYIRGNELYDPLTNGQTVASNMNDVTLIPNQGIRLNGRESFVEYRLPVTLTDGELSMIITNLGNSNEQWKTKVASMMQGDGVNVTDNAYRLTLDRRNADSGGTVRYTLRSRGVDAGEPNAGGMSWSRSRLYLWTYTWNNGSSRLTVKDGGAAGVTVKSVGASYKAPYAPNPHVIRLGSVGGRAGSETLPGTIIRNVWVSSAPRPGFPGDNP